MKFEDNKKKLYISIFVIVSFMLANYHCFLASNLGKSISYNDNLLPQYSKNSFLSIEETNKEMSEDMQYENFFVKFKEILITSLLNFRI